MLDPVVNGEKRDTRIKPGQVLNPNGRPKGSKTKLGAAFFDALYADFEGHGAEAIRQCRETNPGMYLRVCAQIIPQDVTVTHKTVFDELGADDLVRLINSVSSAAARDITSGAGSVIEAEAGTVQTISEAEIIS